MTASKAIEPNKSFAHLNERLAKQAKHANSPSGIWAAIGIPKRGASLFAGLENGFAYSAIEALARYGMSRNELSIFTGIALSTLDRRKSEGHLNTQESDRVYGLVRLIDAATDLFSGDEEKANVWIRKGAKGLGDRAPIDMIRTSAETESVIDFIGRVKHGVIV